MNLPTDTGDFDLWQGQSPLDLVADFHHAFNHPIATTPITLDVLMSDLAEHRCDFIQEEVDEMWAARRDGDVVKFVDSLQDLKYFIYGTELALGIPSEPCFLAVHGSNMDKRQPDGSVKYDPVSNKVQKPEGWVGPEDRIAEILIDAHEAGSPFQLDFDFGA